MHPSSENPPLPPATIRRLPAILAVGVIGVLWLNSVRQAPGPDLPGIPHLDKVLHYFYFGLVATVIYRLPSVKRRPRGAVLAVAVATAVGLVDEILQATSAYRTTDFVDGVFDFLGAVTAVAVYRYWGGYRRFLEWKLF